VTAPARSIALALASAGAALTYAAATHPVADVGFVVVLAQEVAGGACFGAAALVVIVGALRARMDRRAFRSAIATAGRALLGAWVLLNLVTVRWQLGVALPPRADGARAPLWGFPLPWAWWPGGSSAQREIAILALLVDVATYAAVISAVREALRRRPSRLPTWARPGGYALLGFAAGWFVLPWLAGFATGWPTLVAALSTRQVTERALCFASGCHRAL
jgi:hypothetical protein